MLAVYTVQSYLKNQQEKILIKIYVITTQNPERVDRINQYLSGLNFEFVESDSFEKLTKLEKQYKSYSQKFRQKAIMAGEIGAFKTHSQAWEKVLKEQEPSLIIEDNIEFLTDPKELMSEDILEKIRICGLLSFSDISYKLFPDKPFLVSALPDQKPLPIICYGITPERAQDLLTAFKKTAYSMPIDKWLSIPKLCRCYGFINHKSYAKRKTGLASIANKKKGVKNLSILNFFCWILNKKKYKY